jgi:hypothetical protein
MMFSDRRVEMAYSASPEGAAGTRFLSNPDVEAVLFLSELRGGKGPEKRRISSKDPA